MLSPFAINPKCFTHLLVLLTFLFVAISPKTNAQIYGQTIGSAFKGVNWAAVDDNFNNGNLYLSGIDTNFSYADVVKKTDTICKTFKQLLEVNTLRLPINKATVLGLDSANRNWWNNYQGVTDQATAMGFKVILACWEGVPHVGYEKDTTTFFRMWDSVVNKYRLNGNVYFEIFNEPFGYALKDWKAICKSWLNRHPEIRRNRVFIGGAKYDENVATMASDATFKGCLFSRHIYAFWKNISTPAGWASSLTTGVSPYDSLTVVTEFGTEMCNAINFEGTYSQATNTKQNEIRYMVGVPDQINQSKMGAVYWPGLRTNDCYAMLAGNAKADSLVIVNKSGFNRLQYAYNFKSFNGVYTIYNKTKGTSALQHNNLQSFNGIAGVDSVVNAIPDSTSIAQQWKITPVGNGYVTITSNIDSSFLQCSDFIFDSTQSMATHTTCSAKWTVPDSLSDEVLWQMVDAGGGYFKLENKKHPLQCLSATNSYTSTANISTYSACLNIDKDDSNELWKITPISTPLPIKIINYKAFADGNNIKVAWQTMGSDRVAYFEVLTSTDGLHFTLLDKVSALNGATQFMVADNNPVAGTHYYRLESVEIDGSKQFYDTKVVNTSAFDFISIYPNPATSQFTLLLPQLYDKELDVIIKNIAGRIILSKTITLHNGLQGYPFSFNKIEAGLYIVEVKGNNFLKSMKLVIK